MPHSAKLPPEISPSSVLAAVEQLSRRHPSRRDVPVVSDVEVGQVIAGLGAGGHYLTTEQDRRAVLAKVLDLTQLGATLRDLTAEGALRHVEADDTIAAGSRSGWVLAASYEQAEAWAAAFRTRIETQRLVARLRERARKTIIERHREEFEAELRRLREEAGIPAPPGI